MELTHLGLQSPLIIFFTELTHLGSKTSIYTGIYHNFMTFDQLRIFVAKQLTEIEKSPNFNPIYQEIN